MNNKDKILAAAVALLALITAELNSATPTASNPEPAPEPTKPKKDKPAPKAEEPEEPETPEEPEVTLAQLREKASALMADGKASDIKKILAKHKAESLTKLDAKHYAAVDAAFDALSVE